MQYDRLSQQQLSFLLKFIAVVHSQSVGLQQKFVCYRYYGSDKRCADFSLKMHQKRLAAGSPDCGSLYSVLPDVFAGFER